MDFYLTLWRLVTDVCFFLLSSSRIFVSSGRHNKLSFWVGQRTERGYATVCMSHQNCISFPWACHFFRICFFPPVPGRALLLPLLIMTLDHSLPFQFALLAFSKAPCTSESFVSSFLGHVGHQTLAKRCPVVCFYLFLCARFSCQWVFGCPQSQRRGICQGSGHWPGQSSPPSPPHSWVPAPLSTSVSFKSREIW